MADIIYEARKGTVGINWGKYFRDGKVTDEGMPVMKEAMKQFGKGILSENPSYFSKQMIHKEI